MSITYQTLGEAEAAAVIRLRQGESTIYMRIEYHECCDIDTRAPCLQPTYCILGYTDIYKVESEQEKINWGRSVVEDAQELYERAEKVGKLLEDNFMYGLRSFCNLDPSIFNMSALYDLEKIYKKLFYQPLKYLEVTNTTVYDANFFPLRPVKYARRLMISKSGFIGRTGRKKRNGR